MELEELGETGLKKEKVSIAELSFISEYDDVKAEYIDKGYWIDLDTGDINYTANYCPTKKQRNIFKEIDSFFGKKFIRKAVFLSCK